MSKGRQMSIESYFVRKAPAASREHSPAKRRRQGTRTGGDVALVERREERPVRRDHPPELGAFLEGLVRLDVRRYKCKMSGSLDETSDDDAEVPRRGPAFQKAVLAEVPIWDKQTHPFLWFDEHESSVLWKSDCNLSGPLQVCARFREIWMGWSEAGLRLGGPGLRKAVAGAIHCAFFQHKEGVEGRAQSGDVAVRLHEDRSEILEKALSELNKAAERAQVLLDCSEADASMVDAHYSLFRDGGPGQLLEPRYHFEGQARLAHFLRRRCAAASDDSARRLLKNISEQRRLSSRFNEEQRAALQNVCRQLEEYGWGLLVGTAGAGKSTLLRAIAEAAVQFESSDEAREADKVESVVFLGPTNRAVSALIDRLPESVECRTAHSFVFSPSKGDKILAVLDEASMVDVRLACAIADCPALRKAVLLFVGDPFQLLPVGPGEVLRPLLKHRGFPSGVAELRTNRRAKREELQELVSASQRGEVDALLRHSVHVSVEEGQQFDGLFVKVFEFGPSVTLAVRRHEKYCYNAWSIRRARQGEVDAAPSRLTRWPCEYTSFECAARGSSTSRPRLFRPFVDMPVRLLGNGLKDQLVCACKGSLAVIRNVRVKAKEVELMLDFPDGKKGNGHYKSLRVLVKDQRQLVKIMEPAYAITVHDSQGAGFQRVALLLPPSSASPLLTQELAYTGLSRAQEAVCLFSHRDSVGHMRCLGRQSSLREQSLQFHLRCEPRACE